MSTRIVHGCLYGLGACALVVACASPQRPDVNKTAETATRVQIAASTLEDTVVVDCQLPGKLQKLGGMQTYLTPGRLVRATSLDCRTRGGEYTMGDLSSGTLSLKRWQPLAQKGDAEAQYYVARIYANGMSGVDVDYGQAFHWYQLASNQGYKPAMQELGYLYEEGLGVDRNLQLGLNLQRQASGLGDDLDYAWKITEARESAARQVEDLSRQLEQSNSELQETRAQLLAEQNTLARQRSDYRKSQDLVLDLRARLASAKQTGSPQDTAHVKDLESKLAANETALKTDAERIAQMSTDLAARQSELDSSLAKSQAMSLQLNEVVAARQSDQKASQGVTESLRARLAQTEQRLINSEQELSKARTEYQRDVQRAVQEREDFDHARARTTNDAAALVAAKQSQLDRDQLRIQALESDLAAAKRSAASAATTGATAAAAQAQTAAAGAAQAQAQAGAAQAQAQAAAANARNQELTRTLADMKSRYDEAQKQLTLDKQQLALEQTKSSSDRSQVAAQLKQQMAQQLAARDAELAARQRHLDSMAFESDQLRSALKTMQAERDQDTARRSGEARALRQELSTVREQAVAQQSELEKARTDYAREQSDLLTLHTQLDQQRAAGQQNAQTIALLNAKVKEHEAQLKIKDDYIASLTQQISDHPITVADTGLRTRSPGPAGAPPPPRPQTADAKLLATARTYDVEHPGHRYALLIGNSNYGNMNALQTPLNDVRDIGQVLEDNYGFIVVVLSDAKIDDIMIRMDQYAKMLQENDSLLIYFAGHGDRQLGPPERAFWLGTEADARTKSGYLEVANLQEKIKTMKAKHILLVADSCFSGAITHGRSVPKVRDSTDEQLKFKMDHRARMVLTAGGDTPVVDSGGDPDHSLFASNFIDTLRHNRTLMSGEMLAHELFERMQPEAAKLRVKEIPTYSNLSDANHDFGDFYFLPKPLLVAATDSY